MNLSDLVLVGKSIRMRGRPRCAVSSMLLRRAMANNWGGTEFFNASVWTRTPEIYLIAEAFEGL